MTKGNNKVTIGSLEFEKKEFVIKVDDKPVILPENTSVAPVVNVGDTYPYNRGNYRVVALLNDSKVQVKNIIEPFDAPIVPISVLLTKDMFGNA